VTPKEADQSKDRDTHPYSNFEWEVADKYEQKETKLGWVLAPMPQTRPLYRYKPFSKITSGAFLMFANLTKVKGGPAFGNAVSVFVHTYGLLGAPLTRNPTSAPMEHIDTLPRWRRKLKPPLADHHAWVPQMALMNGFLMAAQRIDPYDIVWEYLLPQVNRMLLETCAPTLDWNQDEAVEAKFRLNWVPRSLLGALWLQAAWSVSRPSSFRPCTVCGKFIEISLHRKTGGHRTDTQFCSTNCRSQDLRNRKKQAKERHQHGQTLRAIAKELGTPLSTVQGWLQGSKQLRGSKKR